MSYRIQKSFNRNNQIYSKYSQQKEEENLPQVPKQKENLPKYQYYQKEGKSFQDQPNIKEIQSLCLYEKYFSQEENLVIYNVSINIHKSYEMDQVQLEKFLQDAYDYMRFQPVQEFLEIKMKNFIQSYKQKQYYKSIFQLLSKLTMVFKKLIFSQSSVINQIREHHDQSFGIEKSFSYFNDFLVSAQIQSLEILSGSQEFLKHFLSVLNCIQEYPILENLKIEFTISKNMPLNIAVQNNLSNQNSQLLQQFVTKLPSLKTIEVKNKIDHKQFIDQQYPIFQNIQIQPYQQITKLSLLGDFNQDFGIFLGQFSINQLNELNIELDEINRDAVFEFFNDDQETQEQTFQNLQTLSINITIKSSTSSQQTMQNYIFFKKMQKLQSLNIKIQTQDSGKCYAEEFSRLMKGIQLLNQYSLKEIQVKFKSNDSRDPEFKFYGEKFDQLKEFKNLEKLYIQFDNNKLKDFISEKAVENFLKCVQKSSNLEYAKFISNQVLSFNRESNIMIKQFENDVKQFQSLQRLQTLKIGQKYIIDFELQGDKNNNTKQEGKSKQSKQKLSKNQKNEKPKLSQMQYQQNKAQQIQQKGKNQQQQKEFTNKYLQKTNQNYKDRYNQQQDRTNSNTNRSNQNNYQQPQNYQNKQHSYDTKSNNTILDRIQPQNKKISLKQLQKEHKKVNELNPRKVKNQKKITLKKESSRERSKDRKKKSRKHSTYAFSSSSRSRSRERKNNSKNRRKSKNKQNDKKDHYRKDDHHHNKSRHRNNDVKQEPNSSNNNNRQNKFDKEKQINNQKDQNDYYKNKYSAQNVQSTLSLNQSQQLLQNFQKLANSKATVSNPMMSSTSVQQTQPIQQQQPIIQHQVYQSQQDQNIIRQQQSDILFLQQQYKIQQQQIQQQQQQIQQVHTLQQPQIHNQYVQPQQQYLPQSQQYQEPVNQNPNNNYLIQQQPYHQQQIPQTQIHNQQYQLPIYTQQQQYYYPYQQQNKPQGQQSYQYYQQQNQQPQQQISDQKQPYQQEFQYKEPKQKSQLSPQQPQIQQQQQPIKMSQKQYSQNQIQKQPYFKEEEEDVQEIYQSQQQKQRLQNTSQKDTYKISNNQNKTQNQGSYNQYSNKNQYLQQQNQYYQQNYECNDEQQQYGDTDSQDSLQQVYQSRVYQISKDRYPQIQNQQQQSYQNQNKRKVSQSYESNIPKYQIRENNYF